MRKAVNTVQAYKLLDKVKKEIGRNLMPYSFGGTGMLDADEVVLENEHDPDEIQRRNSLYSILGKLEDVWLEMEFLDRPVQDVGVLRRNDNQRYELNGFELTSGCAIEILVEDPDGHEPSYWARTSIEHDGIDYFAVYGRRRLDGLQARMRE